MDVISHFQNSILFYSDICFINSEGVELKQIMLKKWIYWSKSLGCRLDPTRGEYLDPIPMGRIVLKK